jgi:hypothetical protein
MEVEGKKKVYPDKETYAGKRKKHGGIFCSLRFCKVLFIALVLSVLVMAPLPGSAMIADDTAPAPVTAQSSGCPCNGQCGPQQAPQVIQPQTTDASVTNQAAPASYSPPGVVQQPVVNAPAVNATPVATSVPESAASKPVTINKSISDLMGSFSLAGLKQFVPSWSAATSQPVSLSGNGFMEKMKIKWPMFS